MKHLLIMVAITALFTACGGGSTEQPTEEPAVESTETQENPEALKEATSAKEHAEDAASKADSILNSL